MVAYLLKYYTLTIFLWYIQKKKILMAKKYINKKNNNNENKWLIIMDDFFTVNVSKPAHVQVLPRNVTLHLADIKHEAVTRFHGRFHAELANIHSHKIAFSRPIISGLKIAYFFRIFSRPKIAFWGVRCFFYFIES